MKLRSRNNNNKPIVDRSNSESDLDDNSNLKKLKKKSQTKKIKIDESSKKTNSDSEFEFKEEFNNSEDDFKLKISKKVINNPSKKPNRKKVSNKNNTQKEGEYSGYFSNNDNQVNVKIEDLDSEDDFLEPIKLLKKQKIQSKENPSPKKNENQQKKVKDESKLNSKKKTVSIAPIKNDLNKTENLADNIESLLKMESQFNGPKSTKESESEFMDDDDENSDEDCFEEVQMEKVIENELKLDKMSKETKIEVTIDPKNKKPTKKVDRAAQMERMFKAMQKKLNIALIKTHLVCWLAHGFYLNSIALNEFVRSVVLSVNEMDNSKFKLSNFNQKMLYDYLSKMNKTLIKHETDEQKENFLKNDLLITKENLIEVTSNQKCSSYLQYILLILINLRNLNIKARLCICFDVIQMNDNREKKLVNSSSKTNENSTSKILLHSNKAVKRKSNDSNNKKNIKKIKAKKNEESGEESMYEENQETSSDDSPVKKSTRKNKVSVKKEKINMKTNNLILSSDTDELKKDGIKQENKNSEEIVLGKTTSHHNYRNYWLEVYLEKEKTWCSVEPFEMKINLPEIFEKRFGKRILYVCAFDSDNRVKDVTKRYADEWLIATRLLRVSHLEEKKLWWERTLMFHQPLDANLDIEEETQLKKMLLEKGFPSSVSEFKDHPLYVLRRHLLKFQSIYPQNATPAGMFRDEPIYLRDNLVTLHSRQTWLKLARVVKPFEKSYKIVKGRLKMSEYKAGMRDNPDLDLFGYWQTKEYEPPIAENGRVPRNEFGNVELFQPHMIPVGCVHLKNMPNLNRVCRKLGIDCAAAVIGFDAHGGFSHAVYDGWVVCEEFKDTVVVAFQEEKRIELKKAIEKREAKILNNWAHLVKLVLIREKLKKKYDTKKSIMNKLADDCPSSKGKTTIESIDSIKVGAGLNNPETKKEEDIIMDIDDDDKKVYDKIPINSNKKSKTKALPSKNSNNKKRIRKQYADETDSDEQIKDEKVCVNKEAKSTRKTRVKNTKMYKEASESDKEDNKTEDQTKISNKIQESNANKLNESNDLKLSESESD